MLKSLVALAGLSLASIGTNAGTLIPVVPVSGSTSMFVGDINDNNVILGTYTDSSGSHHAFAGSLDGNYITFDGGPNGTVAASINDDGYITGYSNVDQFDGTKFVPFERFPDGSILDVTKHGKQLYGPIGGVNNGHETFVGSQWSVKQNRFLGYFGKAGEYRRPLMLSIDAVFTAPKDINRSGMVVGWVDPPTRGFVLQKGTTTLVRYPDDSESGTQLYGINDKGLATGIWWDTDHVDHGFLFDVASGSFTPFDVPGASYADIGKPNNAGFFPVNTDIGNYIYCPKRPQKCPAGGQEMSLKTR